jgi:hypothetical protein
MKKLITIVALATAVLAVPAFAKGSATPDARSGSGSGAGNRYQQNDPLDWIHDRAKGYVG